jgi:hypothetical protein
MTFFPAICPLSGSQIAAENEKAQPSTTAGLLLDQMKLSAPAYLQHTILHFLLRAALLILVLASLGAKGQSQQRVRSAIKDVKEGACTVYPNPSSGKFTVSVKELDRHYDINVYNLIGELVFHWESVDGNPADVEVNLSKQPRGLYFVELDTDGANLLKKIVIDQDKGAP